ncbi:GTPase HflX [Gimibacter soli]|uniref:GTPase HflX n=1 Tax=Gimibacter soli TaxID=3024400 RepID=A0AAE9XS14_9PROT|nr:GTPase HflX [Gimibacter soli]WCL52925.1 GTPase HflX [Gimibacter soli]
MSDTDDRSERDGDQNGGGWSAEGLGYLQKRVDKPRVYVVHPDIRSDTAELLERSPAAKLEEAKGLAEAIDIELMGGEIIPVRKRRAATLIGEGKIEDLKAISENQEIDVFVFDAELTPVQQRNLERELKAKVIDRTALILEIFGNRASTREGELQVELAHLTYQKSRLVRSWTHLERQRGGAGFMGGPGETQIEADRRIISDKITRLKRALKDVAKTRTLHRARRQKAPYPIVALVGYTNAGKSTLFNRLTRAEVLAEDMLFATLDPTMRAVEMPSGRKIILSDTVGFISNLPTMLVAAFRATLEEVCEADLIIHVRDASHEDSDIQAADVTEVLKELGIDLDAFDTGVPVIEALNKGDLLSPEEMEARIREGVRHPDRVAISALSGEGTDTLIARIDTLLGTADYKLTKLIPYSDGKARAWLKANAKILSENAEEEGFRIEFQVDPVAWDRFSKNHPLPD